MWVCATLGEAYLLLGDATAARGRYRQSLAIAREFGLDGDLSSMRRQLVLLRDVPQTRPIAESLLALFPLCPVVIFAGHGIDRPGDPVRFPDDPALALAVGQAIREHLDALETTRTFCSPGSGSDVIFCELMLERAGELHLVWPFDEEDFLFERVDFGLAEMGEWRRRYGAVRGLLRHFATTEPYLDDRVLYDFGGTFMQGLALMHAAQLGVKPIALVVRDPASPPDSGLTTFIDNWKRTGHELREIDLAELRERVGARPVPMPPMPPRPAGKTPPRSLRAMLFADVSGYSRVGEVDLPRFVETFLRIVAEELRTGPTQPAARNTWGDALYLVFDTVAECAEFALRLLGKLNEMELGEYGFETANEKRAGVRIGLHYGPVFAIDPDPIIGRRSFFGSHVNRAARIEPITLVGAAFASEQFASALALTPNHRFQCEYLGLFALDKNYDDLCPLYRLTEAPGVSRAVPAVAQS